MNGDSISTAPADIEPISSLTDRIIGCAIAVHRALGPGLLESTYEACLAAELRHAGMAVARQVAMRVVHRNVVLDCGYRLDLLVNDRVVVEAKVVARIEPVHVSQVLTYLRHSHCRFGLIFNFAAPLLKAGGIRRIVWGHSTPFESERTSGRKGDPTREPLEGH